METKYVLDSCALLAYVYKETGADVVKSIFNQADKNDVMLYMNKLNLFESYYDIRRSEGTQQAEDFYSMILMSSIQIIDGISDFVFREAGRIKTSYKISLADSIALGQTSILKASILTSDHHEFDVIEKNEEIKFAWIR